MADHGFFVEVIQHVCYVNIIDYSSFCTRANGKILQNTRFVKRSVQGQKLENSWSTCCEALAAIQNTVDGFGRDQPVGHHRSQSQNPGQSTYLNARNFGLSHNPNSKVVATTATIPTQPIQLGFCGKVSRHLRLASQPTRQPVLLPLGSTYKHPTSSTSSKESSS